MANKFAVSRCCCSVCPTCSRNFSSVVLKPFTTDGPYYNPVYETTYPPSTLGIPKYNLNNVLNNHTSVNNYALSLMDSTLAPYNYSGYVYNFGINVIPSFSPLPYNTLYLDRGFSITGDSMCMYRYNLSSFLSSNVNNWDLDNVDNVNIADDYYFDSLSPYFNFPSFSTPVVFKVYTSLSYSLAIVKNPRINYIYRGTGFGNPITSTEIYSNTETYMVGCLTINTWLIYRGWNSFGGTHQVGDNQHSSRTILYSPKIIGDRNCCINYTESPFLELTDSYRFVGTIITNSSLPVYEYMGSTGTLIPTVEISCE